MLLNVGPTRADNVSGVEKIDISSGTIMPDVARTVMYAPNTSFPTLLSIQHISTVVTSSSRAVEDPVIKHMLQSGVVTTVPLD